MKLSRGTALLVGFDPRTALAVARSLHRRKVRVVIATLGNWEIPVPSRAVAAYLPLPRLDENPSEFLQALLRSIEHYQVDTLIPITDRALVALAPHQDRLRNRVRLLGPNPEQTAIVLDKMRTSRLAAKLEIPTPVTIAVETVQGLSDAERCLSFPIFLKPRNKALTCLTDVTPGPEVFVCETIEALRSRYRELSSKNQGQLLAQERVPGEDVGLAVVMQGGEAVSIFQYRALRMWPSAGGVCVAGCSETVHTGMADCAVRLLRALSWEGVAELDFRHDRQTGRFALLEVNGRFWGSTAAATASGADMPWMVWQLAGGQLERTEPYRSGQRARWLEGDVRRLLDVIRVAKKSHQWGQLARELVGFFRDFRPGVRGMYWSWRDPLPGFHAIGVFVYWWCAARFRRGTRSAPHPALTLQPISSTNPP